MYLIFKWVQEFITTLYFISPMDLRYLRFAYCKQPASSGETPKHSNTRKGLPNSMCDTWTGTMGRTQHNIASLSFLLVQPNPKQNVLCLRFDVWLVGGILL